MTGFANVEEGIVHFFQHIGGVVDADLEAAATMLKPLLAAVVAEIKAKGLPVVETAVATLASAAGAALSGSETKSVAADAGIAAVKAAGIELGEDALHALATAAVTG